MGRDKAFVTHEHRPLVMIARDALVGAGADRVFCLGGDVERLREAGLVAYPDTIPGAGPLAALLEAFELATTDVVVVLACDLPRANADSVAATVEALESHPVVMPMHEDRPQYLHAAYHRKALPDLSAAFDRGERSLHRALADMEVAMITVRDPASLADADRPEDLE